MSTWIRATALSNLDVLGKLKYRIAPPETKTQTTNHLFRDFMASATRDASRESGGSYPAQKPMLQPVRCASSPLPSGERKRGRKKGKGDAALFPQKVGSLAEKELRPLFSPLHYSDGTAIAAQYRFVQGTLFGSGVNFQDVVQGNIGDCWLMSSLEETAIQKPQMIRNMFIDNGDATYTVRFFHNGTPEYTTVDRIFPIDLNTNQYCYANMGKSCSDSSVKLWVALAEKAYAQLDESGWTGRPATQQSNSYASLDAGRPTYPLSQISGVAASSGTLYASLSSALEADFHAGRLITFITRATLPANAPVNLVPNHVYAMFGYFGNNVFAVANPWGPNSTENGVSAGMIFLTVNQMVDAGFDGWAEVNFSWHISAVQTAQMTRLSLGHAGGALPAAPVSSTIPGVDVHAEGFAHEQAFVRTPLVATMASVIAGDEARAVEMVFEHHDTMASKSAFDPVSILLSSLNHASLDALAGSGSF
jgi:hypothetical protein